MEAGKRYNLAPTGPSDIRRIEAGILNYGIDMTLENNPYEVGLERLVSLEKEFIGKEALQKISSQGPRRKLVGIEIEGPRIEMNFTRWPVKGGGCGATPRRRSEPENTQNTARAQTDASTVHTAPAAAGAC